MTGMKAFVRSMAGIFLRLRRRPRGPLRKCMGLVLPSTVKRRLDPLSNPGQCWPLNGPLRGYVFKVRTPVETQYILADPYFEPHVCHAIQRIVRPGMACADIGANIGFITLLCAHCAGPSGRVYAFEALPWNVEQLMENVRINGLQDRVVIENKAITDGASEWVTLYEGATDTEGSVVRRSGRSAGIAAPAVSLDAYAADHLTQFDFVKIDIEGGEALAVAGMQRLLRECRPVCLIEAHGRLGLRALQQCTDAGYRLSDLSDAPVVLQALDPDAIHHILARPEEATL